jgi:hypothetical protein
VTGVSDAAHRVRQRRGTRPAADDGPAATSTIGRALITSNSPLLAKGLKISKQVLGEDHVNKSIAGVGEFARDDGGMVGRVLLGAFGQGPAWPPCPLDRQSCDAGRAEGGPTN